MPALFSLACLAACATIPDAVRDVDPVFANRELHDVPFVPQERFQCGPAALATVLQYSGVPADPDVLARQVYLPGREGSLQVELVAAARAAGRLPYRVDGTLGAVAAELAAGRPVLVLQNLGVNWYPRWHYAVVVGITGKDVVLRSGTDERRVTPIDTFLRTWQRSDYWGLVVVAPGNLPARANRQRYLAAVSALEETGHVASARTGWQAALRAWPDDELALLGLGNAELLAGEDAAAEVAYRRLLVLRPQFAAARNNLAVSLMHQKRFDEARAEAELAREQTGDDMATAAAVRDTLLEIHAARTATESTAQPQ